MIKRIEYKNLDFLRYNECLEQSAQKNFYARKEILDVLSESWEVLIYGDYDYVMPVPLKKKFGFQIVLMPIFCQQLGVFGTEINEKIELEFLHFLKKNYKIFSYSFNYQNLLTQNLDRKKNYFIEKTDYKLLRKNYFKGRKSTVKTAQYLSFKEVNKNDNLDFIKNNFKGLNKKKDSEKFFEYLTHLEVANNLKLYGSFKNEDLISLAVIIEDENSLSLLGLVNDEKFKTDNGASYLIDQILQKNIAQKSFNFMGSNIRGIEIFFKSFGSVLQDYPILENSRIDLLKNLFTT